jgi:hypothetical protein
MKARMLTFHVEAGQVPSLVDAVAEVGERMSWRPDFRGFVCLDHDGVRHEIMVLSLWDGHGMEDTQVAFEKARSEIAASVDLGMRTSELDVLCFIPGVSQDEGAVPVLASVSAAGRW